MRVIDSNMLLSGSDKPSTVSNALLLLTSHDQGSCDALLHGHLVRLSTHLLFSHTDTTVLRLTTFCIK